VLNGRLAFWLFSQDAGVRGQRASRASNVFPYRGRRRHEEFAASETGLETRESQAGMAYAGQRDALGFDMGNGRLMTGFGGLRVPPSLTLGALIGTRGSETVIPSTSDYLPPTLNETRARSRPGRGAGRLLSALSREECPKPMHLVGKPQRFSCCRRTATKSERTSAPKRLILGGMGGLSQR